MTSGSSIVDGTSRSGDLSSHSAYSGITHPTEYTGPMEVDSGQRFRPPPSQAGEQSTVTAPPMYSAD
jgi:hypothetical protein